MNCALGLRDRKKAATRAALSRAAVQIALARGMENVTAESVAAKAGVSTRTFHNYFAGKEEAVVHHLETLADSWGDRLRQRPADEPVWDSLLVTVLAEIEAPERDLQEVFALMQLVETTPALHARTHAMHSSVVDRLGEAIAERTGTNFATDMYPRLLQMASGIATKAALDLWFTNPDQAASPADLVVQAFAMVRGGLPEPPTSPNYRSPLPGQPAAPNVLQN